MMRYTIYEGKEDFVNLKDEITYLIIGMFREEYIMNLGFVIDKLNAEAVGPPQGW